ncbi:MAG: DnaD domain protein [Anaerolineaceae bacterium]|nr:DnaD domain protein [Anaerolineaceae bacterium]
MNTFQGFPPGKLESIKIPELLFTDGLRLLNNTDEIKLILFFFWAINIQESSIRYLQEEEIVESEILKTGLGTEDFAKRVKNSLSQSVHNGFLLRGHPKHNKKITLYFLNTARSRAALEALINGGWQPSETDHLPPENAYTSKKTIYEIYEENIGPLTPLLAEDMKEAEEEYSTQWVKEAIHLAVQGNIRKWRYIEGILRSWKKEGKNANTRRSNSENGRIHTKGEFDDFIQR